MHVACRHIEAITMHTIMSPATQLMNRLKYRPKMAIVTLFFMLPLLAVSYLLLQELNTGIALTAKEQRGLEYIRTVRQLYQHLPQHRGMTHAYLNGAAAFRDKIMATRDRIREDIRAIDAVDRRYGGEFGTRSSWKSIKDDWRRLEQRAFDGRADRIFAAHTQLIGRIYRLFSRVSNQSGLLLDPELNTALLIDALVYRLPLVTENLGQARGLGSGVAASGDISLDQRARLGTILANITANRTSIEESMRISFGQNPSLERRIGKIYQLSTASTTGFIDKLKSELLLSGSIGADAADIFNSGTAAIKANYRLYDALMPTVDELLQQRKSQLINERNVVLALVLFCVGLALYLFGGFYYSVTDAVRLLDEKVSRIAAGDLTVRIESRSRDEISSIATALNDMVTRFRSIIAQLASHSGQLATASTELSATTEQARDGATEQQCQTEQIATAMNEMSTTVQEIAASAEAASENARNANQEAESGGTVIRETIDAINHLSDEVGKAAEVIHELEASSANISGVVEVIQGIAEQTNLLALNAAIEAARAGEQGRGFAVVADEVRTLAGRTQDSTEEIQKMMETLLEQTGNAVAVMERDKHYAEELATQAGEANNSLSSIMQAVDNIQDMTTQVASASEEQTVVSEEINRNVSVVADIAHANVSGSEQIAAASEELTRFASELEAVVQRFKV